MKATRRAALILVALGLLAFASPAAADRVYFSNGSGIFYADLDTGAGAKLEVSGAATTNVHGIAIDPAAGKIYWSGEPERSPLIGVANLDGSGGEALSTSGAPINHPYAHRPRRRGGTRLLGQLPGPGRADRLCGHRRQRRRGNQHHRGDGRERDRDRARPARLEDLLDERERAPLLRESRRQRRRQRQRSPGPSTGPGFYKGARSTRSAGESTGPSYKSASPYEPVRLIGGSRRIAVDPTWRRRGRRKNSRRGGDRPDRAPDLLGQQRILPQCRHLLCRRSTAAAPTSSTSRESPSPAPTSPPCSKRRSAPGRRN